MNQIIKINNNQKANNIKSNFLTLLKKKNGLHIQTSITQQTYQIRNLHDRKGRQTLHLQTRLKTQIKITQKITYRCILFK